MVASAWICLPTNNIKATPSKKRDRKARTRRGVGFVVTEVEEEVE